MIQEKTVKELFLELPAGYRQRALSSMTNENDVEKLMSSAILTGLIKWENTPEGTQFWAQVYDHFLEREQPQYFKINQVRMITPLPELPNVVNAPKARFI